MRLLLWMASISLMWVGWGAIYAGLGPPALLVGTALAVMLFLRQRSPDTTLALVGVLSAGWLPVLIWHPWLAAVPLAATAVTVRAMHREERARDVEASDG